MTSLGDRPRPHTQPCSHSCQRGHSSAGDIRALASPVVSRATPHPGAGPGRDVWTHSPTQRRHWDGRRRTGQQGRHSHDLPGSAGTGRQGQSAHLCPLLSAPRLQLFGLVGACMSSQGHCDKAHSQAAHGQAPSSHRLDRSETGRHRLGPSRGQGVPHVPHGLRTAILPASSPGSHERPCLKLPLRGHQPYCVRTQPNDLMLT